MSGPEGTPNGVDRLAQVAGRKSFYDEDGEWVYLSAAERDALVEIAKAARAYRRHEEGEPDAYMIAHAGWESFLYQRQAELDDALARLDSGAAEEDA